ncbi:MAG: T9SS type A sorting domain-containing protein [candidate division Zixibacteria bacterium]|nr:T9SS type A sorting domain-containing protein [candidate division Zixibacteria bacterium]
MKKSLFLILIISLLSAIPALGIQLNFEQVDSAPYGITMYYSQVVHLCDVNNDGIDEIIAKSDYSRNCKIIIYDFVEDEVIFESEPLGCFIQDICPTDINDDGEIDLLYCYNDYDNNTHKLDISYGPDFQSSQTLYENHVKWVDIWTFSKNMIKQEGTFRGHQKPIYFLCKDKLLVLGDNFEVVDSIPSPSALNLYYYTVNRTENGEYKLVRYCKIHPLDGQYYYDIAKVAFFNESFERTEDLLIFSIMQSWSNYGGIAGFLESFQHPDSTIYHYLSFYAYNYDGCRNRLVRISYNGEEIHGIAGVDGFHGLIYPGALFGDYLGDGRDRILTLQEDDDPLRLILRENYGDSIGWGLTEGLSINCLFGDWDNEPGKELFVSDEDSIRIFKIWESTTDVNEDDPPSLPINTELLANYPNPFNSSTTIKYIVNESNDNQNIRLEIFNLLGERVATFVDEKKHVGEYTVSWDASEHTTGIYFAKLTCGELTYSKKMVYLK